MQVALQYKINQNPLYKKFLSENSYWYKYLNRSALYFPEFLKDMKEKYKLTTEDKLKKMSDNLDTISQIINILN